MKSVAVFFGGESIEHDISVITGVLTLNSVEEKCSAVPVYVDKDGTYYTGKSLFNPDGYKNLDYKKLQKVTFLSGDNKLYKIKGKRITPLVEIAVSINCMHGERGEDGTISALMGACGIPLASPDIAPSSVCINKSLTKIMLKGLGIAQVPSVTVENASFLDAVKELGFPLIVKPCTGGSSIGVGVARDEKELILAVNEALRYSERAVIEPMLENFTEINCACFKDSRGNLIVSECEKPIGAEEVLTFNDKYQGGKREFPAKIENKYSNKIKKITEKIYRELQFRGVIRIDFFIWQKKVLVNEINTVPGSLAYYLFCKNTLEFKKMLSEMINSAFSHANKKSLIKKAYNSGILLGLKAKGSKNVRK